MGKIITVASQKGGVGKTTTVLNLGYSLTRIGQNVMLMDADPQGALALATNLKKRSSQGLLHLLKREAAPRDIIFRTKDQTMSVVGVGEMEPEDVLLFEKEAIRKNLARVVYALSRDHDYVLVDAPSGVGHITASLLAISHGVILPVNCRALALKTLPSFLKLIHKLREKLNPELQLNGILLTMVDNQNATEQELMAEARASFPESAMFRTVIPRDEAFERASTQAVPIALMSASGDAVQSYIDLAFELRQRELLQQRKGVSDDEQVEGLF